MIRKFDAVMNSISAGASFLGALWIFAIMVFVCCDIGGRLFFNHPIIGTPEIVQNSLAAIAFLMLPWATHLGQHVRSTVIRDSLPRRAGYLIDMVSFTIAMLLFIGIIYASLTPALRATRIRDFQGEGLRVPIYPVWWFIIFGSALSCYQCISKVVRAFLLMMGKKNVESLREHGGAQV